MRIYTGPIKFAVDVNNPSECEAAFEEANEVMAELQQGVANWTTEAKRFEAERDRLRELLRRAHRELDALDIYARVAYPSVDLTSLNALLADIRKELGE